MSLTTSPIPSHPPLPSSLASPALTAVSPAGHGLPRARQAPVWLKVALVVGGVLVLAGIGLGVKGVVSSSASSGIDLTAAVTRGDLPIIVTERGDLESSKTITAKCEVEFSGEQQRSPGLKIISILPEGTRVKKGQKVVELDTDKLKRTLAEQEVK